MKKSEFFYELPQELIAQHPIEPRDASKIMILNKYNGKIEHKIFRDIIKYLKKGDCLVLNDTRVIPARLIGAKKETGGKIEFLLLKRIDKDTWEVLTKPGKKAVPGAVFEFGNGKLEAEILEILEEGIRKVKFNYNGIFEEILDELGQMPLPPYITEKLEDKERYQTVYSKQSGSAAAPTAGLHFTNDLLENIKKKGVEVVFVTLHVGLGTFRPVKEDEIEQHPMHSEFYSITKESADIINNVKATGGRVICVGTTSCRVIESVADENGKLREKSGWTEIFIYPGYKFKILDCLITNFHLPESTLVMLVSALAGRENILNAYNEAVNKEYRFFSFGDAMFVTNAIEEGRDV